MGLEKRTVKIIVIVAVTVLIIGKIIYFLLVYNFFSNFLLLNI